MPSIRSCPALLGLCIAMLFGCSDAREAPNASAKALAPTQPVTAADWQAQIAERIAAGEYRLRAEAGTLKGWNRQHGLRAEWTPEGVAIDVRASDAATPSPAPARSAVSARAGATRPALPSATKGPATAADDSLRDVGRLAIRTTGIARGDRRLGAEPGAFAVGRCRSDNALDELGECLKRAESDRRFWVEWWENRQAGLEQGFDISVRPLAFADDEPLRIELAVDGVQIAVSEDGASATFSGAGVNLRYGDLAARDANDNALPIRLLPAAGGLAIEVDDYGAQYPISVDPLLTTGYWSRDSNQTNAHFGFSVASAGDVNGDGFGDVIVGAPGYGANSEGQAFLYLGAASGLAASAAWTQSGTASAQFGYSVAGAGDVNGDGLGDVIVGAPFYTNGETSEGAVFVYHGSASGLPLNASYNWHKEGNAAGILLGVSVASAGDVNNDGVGDVIVSAPAYSNGQNAEGSVRIYLGVATTGLAEIENRLLESNQSNAYFGMSVASAGDVNGDGFSDVIVGAPYFTNGETTEGEAFIYLGGSGGIPDSSWWFGQSDQQGAMFGTSVAAAGDVNGDGLGDVIVGAPLYESASGQIDEGRAYVYYGHANIMSASPSWYAELDQASANFGVAVASAGDINGDGYGDVIIGADRYDSLSQTDVGAAVAYYGSANGVLNDRFWLSGNQVSSGFGHSVASAGDPNGDGRSDVIVGAQNYSNGQTSEGQAFVYYASNMAASSPSAAWSVETNQASARCRRFANAGDVNGDGYDDVLLAYTLYDSDLVDEGHVLLLLGSATGPVLDPAGWTAESNQAGAGIWSAAGAGDVNGDGYADVIVSSIHYANGQTDEGRAQVYHGSAAGLSNTPAWTKESDLTNAQFGSSAASAGDVNGDGFGDVVVGAYQLTAGEVLEGGVLVYHGSANGLSTTASWLKQSNLANAGFGFSAASAGDVNRDGFGDLIVGAPTYTNNETEEGNAVVYLGSANGLAASPIWNAEPNSANAQFGFSVASAGDVNGDGFADVIVGAPAYTNPEISEGAVFVYFGNATGVDAMPWSYSSNVANALLGYSVASAGDANSDGYADIIAGAPLYASGAGLTVGFFGSGSGVSTNYLVGQTSGQSGSYFGIAVDAADVNGDGYSDVLVAAQDYENGQTDEGGAFLYYGNGSDGTRGLSLRPQMRRPNLTTPILPSNKSFSSSGFDAVMRAVRGPMGRTRIKLQVEVKPLGTNFNGTTGLSTSAWTLVGTAGTTMKRLIDSSLGATPHWRARLIYDPSRGPQFQRSRWIYGGKLGHARSVHVRIAP